MNGQDLKNSILQLAIQGKLVPQDPNDEPASELLAKIRKEKERLVKDGKLKKKDLVTTPISDEDKPFEIPEGWEWCTLGEIVVLLSGQDLTPNRYFDSEKGIPYITGASHFVNGSLKVSRWTDSPTSVSHLGDLLITCKGTVGTMAYNKIGDIHIARQIMAITPIYVYLPYIQHNLEYIVPELEKKAHSIIPGISREVLLTSLIPLPPLSEQHRIVAKIEEVMPLVEEYDKAQTKLDKLNDELPEQLKQSILQEAIMGKLGTQDPNDEPASELLKRIRKEKEQLVKEKKIKKEKALPEISDEEKPFEIPDNWVWCRLGKLVNMRIGKTPARSDEKNWSNGVYPWVSISDMTDYSHIRSTKEMVSLYAADNAFGAISEPGTLIMSFKLTVGRTCILDIAAYHNEAIISIDTYCDPDNNLRDYLFRMLPLLSNLGESKDAIKGKTLNSDSLSNLLIPLPPLAEQHRIVEKLDELLPKIDKLRK